MVNAQNELRKGGVAGLFRAIGLNELAVEEFAAAHGADFKSAWAGMVENPVLMLEVALELGVPVVDIVEILASAVRDAVRERGEPMPEFGERILSATEVALADIEKAKFRDLAQLVVEAAVWMGAASKGGDVGAPTPCDCFSIMGAASVAQGALIAACTCGGEDHKKEFRKVTTDVCFSVSYSRVLHAERVGRIPKTGSDKIKAAWSARFTGLLILEHLPAELVTAPRMVTIPSVTHDGRVVQVKRERGQA